MFLIKNVSDQKSISKQQNRFTFKYPKSIHIQISLSQSTTMNQYIQSIEETTTKRRKVVSGFVSGSDSGSGSGSGSVSGFSTGYVTEEVPITVLPSEEDESSSFTVLTGAGSTGAGGSISMPNIKSLLATVYDLQEGKRETYYQHWKKKRANGSTGWYRVNSMMTKGQTGSHRARCKIGGKSVLIGVFKLGTNAAKAYDLFAKFVGFSNFNFQNDEEYVLEKKRELQRIYECYSVEGKKEKDRLLQKFDQDLPTDSVFQEKLQKLFPEISFPEISSNVDANKEETAHNLTNAGVANKEDTVILADAIPDIILDTNSIHSLTNKMIPYRHYNPNFCNILKEIRKGTQISLVNQTESSITKTFSSNYKLVIAVDQSEDIRTHPLWKDNCDIMHRSNSRFFDSIMMDSCVLNRNCKQAVMSYSQYSRAPDHFAINGLFFVRIDLLDDLRCYEKSENTDPSFPQTMHVLRVVDCCDDNVFVENLEIVESWKENKLKWLKVTNANQTCLVVFGLAAAEGFCPHHPLKDPCTARKQTADIDFHCNTTISLGGIRRFNGLCDGQICYIATCNKTAISRGLCCNHDKLKLE